MARQAVSKLAQPENTIALWCTDEGERFIPKGHYGLVIDGREGLAHFVNLVSDLFDDMEAKQIDPESYTPLMIAMPDGQAAVLVRY